MCIQEIIFFLEQHIILCISWCLLLVIILFITYNNWINAAYEISCNTAVFLINRNNAIVLDIRSENDYFSGYVMNSINIPFQKIKRNSAFQIKKLKKNILIIISNSNFISHAAKKRLIKLGCKEVYVLKGGIHIWKSNGLPFFCKK